MRPKRKPVYTFWLANKTAISVLASQLFATLVNATVKYLESGDRDTINPLQVLHTRTVIGATLCTIMLSMLQPDNNANLYGDLPSTRRLRFLLALRALAGVCGVVGFYYSLVYMPLTDATVLNLLAPMTACCIAGYLGNTSFGFVEMLAVASCFLGAVLIVQPELFSESDGGSMIKRQAIGAIFALAGASGGSISYVCIRLIGAELHPLVTVKYFAISVLLVTSFILLVTMPARNTIHPRIGFFRWGLNILVGLLGFVMECLLSFGLSQDDTSQATQTIYVQPLLSLLFDWFIWGIAPRLSSKFGGLIIVMSTVGISVRQSKRLQRQKDRFDQYNLQDMDTFGEGSSPGEHGLGDRSDVTPWDLGG